MIYDICHLCILGFYVASTETKVQSPETHRLLKLLVIFIVALWVTLHWQTSHPVVLGSQHLLSKRCGLRSVAVDDFLHTSFICLLLKGIYIYIYIQYVQWDTGLFQNSGFTDITPTMLVQFQSQITILAARLLRWFVVAPGSRVHETYSWFWQIMWMRKTRQSSTQDSRSARHRGDFWHWWYCEGAIFHSGFVRRSPCSAKLYSIVLLYIYVWHCINVFSQALNG